MSLFVFDEAQVRRAVLLTVLELCVGAPVLDAAGSAQAVTGRSCVSWLVATHAAQPALATKSTSVELLAHPASLAKNGTIPWVVTLCTAVVADSFGSPGPIDVRIGSS